MSQTVLILGAAGRVGSAAASAFAQAGWTVRAQARKPLPAALNGHAAISAVSCDATDASAVGAAAQGADVLVHALSPPYTEWDRWVLPLADIAMNAARASGALLMLPGNVYNYGSRLPPVLAPETPQQGDIAKARVRIELEARMAGMPGLHSVVLRAGDFYGSSQRGSWFDLSLARQLASGVFMYPGNPQIEHAWAYLPDLARTFVRVAEQRTRWQGPLKLHFAGHTVTGEQMREAFEVALGRRLRTKGMPWTFFRIASPLVPAWREILVMRYLWERPHRLDDTDLRQLIGDVPHTPFQDAVTQALRDLQQL